MQYIKHYYVDDEGNNFCCGLDGPKYKRHPVQEYPGLDVKVWLNDPDGVPAMIAEVPDTTSVSDIVDDCGKKAVQVLSKAEYDSVYLPYYEASVLFGEAFSARSDGNDELAIEKESQAQLKMEEAQAAFHSLCV
jgi:hypothetical protein